jgi:hypothetical protein
MTIAAPTIGAANGSDQPFAWNIGTTGITESRDVNPRTSGVLAVIACSTCEGKLPFEPRHHRRLSVPADDDEGVPRRLRRRGQAWLGND